MRRLSYLATIATAALLLLGLVPAAGRRPREKGW